MEISRLSQTMSHTTTHHNQSLSPLSIIQNELLLSPNRLPKSSHKGSPLQKIKPAQCLHSRSIDDRDDTSPSNTYGQNHENGSKTVPSDSVSEYSGASGSSGGSHAKTVEGGMFTVSSIKKSPTIDTNICDLGTDIRRSQSYSPTISHSPTVHTPDGSQKIHLKSFGNLIYNNNDKGEKKLEKQNIEVSCRLPTSRRSSANRLELPVPSKYSLDRGICSPGYTDPYYTKNKSPILSTQKSPIVSSKHSLDRDTRTPGYPDAYNNSDRQSPDNNSKSIDRKTFVNLKTSTMDEFDQPLEPFEMDTRTTGYPDMHNKFNDCKFEKMIRKSSSPLNRRSPTNIPDIIPDSNYKSTMTDKLPNVLKISNSKLKKNIESGIDVSLKYQESSHSRRNS
jgi:hypothetical protein